MGLDRIQLSGKEILDKDFKTGIRGYNQDEVDQFLDVIIQDYEAFHQEIERLKQENAKLKKQGDVPKQRVRSSEASPAPSRQTGQVNYDVLQRLSNLEKAVFGKKYADS
ncbi:cell division protein DivIVA [Pontibacillus chungwhensis BH030062]|uniref:Cell cycle protein GpsB n=1 Tax=Pontibacillus chungwhensis BH030062 TaxID=1385513 RepID=A0A0A2VHJ3_9BACI|nr:MULTISPECIES: cell division regulator GpsB [Pontibacillus]KGP93090.1 cell division protein DivIVA [Pontibacillus chungwhensis BH030062]QSS98421.1 cell division regulator GpsB [Pontibacillus sp. ALD_SL1]